MVRKFAINSKYLKRDVNIYLRFPAERDFENILFMLDGHNAFFAEDASFGETWKMDETVTRLEAEGKYPPTLIVGMECNHENEGLERLREYSFCDNSWIVQLYAPHLKELYPQGLKARGELHESFMLKELIPYVEKDLQISIADYSRGIIGSSMGGMMSLLLALRNQDLFDNVYCVSNAFWYCLSQVLNFIEKTNVKNDNLHIYLDTGTQESDIYEYVKANDQVYEFLKNSGFAVIYNLIEGAEHNETAWAKRLEQILLFEKL